MTDRYVLLCVCIQTCSITRGRQCVNNKDKVHVLIKTHYCITMSLAQISPRVGAILEMICLNPDAFSLAKIGTKPSVASILGDTMPPLSSVCSQ